MLVHGHKSRWNYGKVRNSIVVSNKEVIKKNSQNKKASGGDVRYTQEISQNIVNGSNRFSSLEVEENQVADFKENQVAGLEENPSEERYYSSKVMNDPVNSVENCLYEVVVFDTAADVIMDDAGNKDANNVGPTTGLAVEFSSQRSNPKVQMELVD